MYTHARKNSMSSLVQSTKCMQNKIESFGGIDNHAAMRGVYRRKCKLLAWWKRAGCMCLIYLFNIAFVHEVQNIIKLY